MTGKIYKEWHVIAEECEILAGEYYELWVDCRFCECWPEAECAYDHYLEQLKMAKAARKRAM